MKENLAVVVKGRLSVRDEKAPQIVCDSIYPLTTADGGIPEPQPKQEASGETLFLKFPSIEDPAIRHMKLVFQMFPGKSTVKRLWRTPERSMPLRRSCIRRWWRRQKKLWAARMW